MIKRKFMIALAHLASTTELRLEVRMLKTKKMTKSMEAYKAYRCHHLIRQSGFVDLLVNLAGV